MTTIDTAALRALAEKAKTISDEHSLDYLDEYFSEWRSTMTPSTVLALLDERERLRQVLRDALSANIVGDELIVEAILRAALEGEGR